MNLKEKLLIIQTELKAPKGQFNSFGGYKYRSCEDILEAVKPLLAENKVILTITDTVDNIGERFYIKAAAVLADTESDESIINTAYARESDDKKGMDGSQITGTASSYARKYALNGLFLIDDTKDADTNQFRQQQDASKITPEFLQSHGQETITAREVDLLILALNRSGKTMDQALNACKVREPLRITYCQFAALMAQCG